MITINLDVEDNFTPRLQRALAELAEPSKLMSDIGEYMAKTVRDRFNAQIGPDGTPWAPRSQATLDSYRAKRTSFSPRILHWEGILSAFPAPVHGPDFVQITVNRDYAAMMQFGGTKAQFPNLWGDIPARPYFGFSDENQNVIVEIVADWLEGIFQ